MKYKNATVCSELHSPDTHIHYFESNILPLHLFLFSDLYFSINNFFSPLLSRPLVLFLFRSFNVSSLVLRVTPGRATFVAVSCPLVRYGDSPTLAIPLHSTHTFNIFSLLYPVPCRHFSEIKASLAAHLSNIMQKQKLSAAGFQNLRFS